MKVEEMKVEKKFLKSLIDKQFVTQNMELYKKGMRLKQQKEYQDHDQRPKKNMQEALWDILPTWNGNWEESQQEVEIDAVEKMRRSLKNSTQWRRNKKNQMNKVQAQVQQGRSLPKSSTRRKKKELRTKKFKMNQEES